MDKKTIYKLVKSDYEIANRDFQNAKEALGNNEITNYFEGRASALKQVIALFEAKDWNEYIDKILERK